MGKSQYPWHDGRLTAAMSDAHHHHHGLSHSSIRFCRLCGGALARQPVPPEGKQEMVCGGCAFIFYLYHKVVAGTIPELEGRVLLTRRSIEPARGKWTYPGGFVDWGEAVEAAAVRETREETGLEGDLDGLLGVYSYPGTPIVIVDRARVISAEVRTCWENDCVEWVAPADIPWEQLAFPSTIEALRAFLNGKESRG